MIRNIYIFKAKDEDYVVAERLRFSRTMGKITHSQQLFFNSPPPPQMKYFF